MLVCISDLFDLTHTIAAPLLSRFVMPWEALDFLSDFIYETGAQLDSAQYDSPADGVWIAKSARVAENAVILPPCIIGARAEIRPGAYIRGSVIVGEDAVVGIQPKSKTRFCLTGCRFRTSTTAAIPFSATEHIWGRARSHPTSRVIKRTSQSTARIGSRPDGRSAVRCSAILSRSGATACSLPVR